MKDRPEGTPLTGEEQQILDALTEDQHRGYQPSGPVPEPATPPPGSAGPSSPPPSSDGPVPGPESDRT